MAQLFNPAVMTDGGIDLLVRVQAGETGMAFTRMAIGDGEYTDEEKETSALQEMSALKSERNSYELSSITAESDGYVKVTAVITNQDPDTLETLVTEGYYINEIALFAQADDSDEEVMYSIAVTSGDEGDFMPAYNGVTPAQIIQDYYATIANGAEVTITTGGAVYTASQGEALEARVTALETILTSVSSDTYVSDETLYLSLSTLTSGDDEVEEVLEEVFSDESE